MLPTYTALFEEHRWLCVTRSVHYTERELHEAQIAIARARLFAVTLAAGREEDEPAALLLALLLEKDALGEVCNTFPVVSVVHFLRASQRADLTVDLTSRIQLRAVRARALPLRHAPEQLRGLVGELRGFLATRLRPLP
jgi:hypothetical protein